MLSHVSLLTAAYLLFCLTFFFFSFPSLSCWPVPPPVLSRLLARSLPDPHKVPAPLVTLSPGRCRSSASAVPACLPIAALHWPHLLRTPSSQPPHCVFLFLLMGFVTHYCVLFITDHPCQMRKRNDDQTINYFLRPALFFTVMQHRTL